MNKLTIILFTLFIFTFISLNNSFASLDNTSTFNGEKENNIQKDKEQEIEEIEVYLPKKDYYIEKFDKDTAIPMKPEKQTNLQEVDDKSDLTELLSSYGKLPVSSLENITSEFGLREHPIEEELHFHTGIDIDGEEGEEINTVLGGDIEETGEGENNGKGNYVVVDHYSNFKTKYLHLEAIKVDTGESVSSGEQIGTMGETGTTTGVHLHFEILKNGNYTDPLPYLKAIENN